MAKWFKTLWAASGDKTAVPDALDVSGAVSYTEGYNLNYERVLGTDPLARAIERQKLNYVLSDVTGALQQYQTKGFPDYIDAATNGGTAYAYAINAVVRFTDDKNYLNTVAGNTNAPNVSGWVLHDDIASTVHAATSKTTPVDADEFGLVDSAASNVLKKLTWANLKSAIGTYIGLTYAPIASPTFTGNPVAPTPTATDNDTSIATTAHVHSAITNDLNVTGNAPMYACRAWANFNGITLGSFAGGASTVSRTSGSTTATITTTTPHLLISGNYVQALTGVVAGTYEVTVVNATTFTITTVATTVLSAVAITFQFSTITNSGNINSIVKVSTGIYIFNFSASMPNSGYSTVGMNTAAVGGLNLCVKSTPDYNGTVDIYTQYACKVAVGNGSANRDATMVVASIFG